MKYFLPKLRLQKKWFEFGLIVMNWFSFLEIMTFSTELTFCLKLLFENVRTNIKVPFFLDWCKMDHFVTIIFYAAILVHLCLSIYIYSTIICFNSLHTFFGSWTETSVSLTYSFTCATLFTEFKRSIWLSIQFLRKQKPN